MPALQPTQIHRGLFMRVILANRFVYPDEAATSRMMSSLAFGLAARGLEVHVVGSRQRHDNGPLLSPHEVVHGVNFHRVATAGFGRKRLLGRAIDYGTHHLAAGWRIRRLARRGDVVIVGTDPPLFSVTVAAALAGSGALLVNWMLDLFPEAAIELGVLPRHGLATRLLCTLRDASLNRARLNVAPIGRMADLLQSRGIAADNMIVMPQWSDGDAIRPVETKDNPIRLEWGLKDRFVIGYSGNFGRVHEFGTILDAAELLLDQPDVAFLFVGDGQRRAFIETEVKRRGLTNVQMHPLQPRERLSQSLGACDVHLVSLLPNLEPCSVPSKFYGILAAGRPTLFVGDEDGEIARIIARTGCGHAVQIGEAAQLANHILELKHSPEKWREMCLVARDTFEEEFRESVGLEAWERLIRGLQARAAVDVAPHAALKIAGADQE
jgi:colanic acid biosynthesis glycosyl transferase WcaI